MFSFCALLPVQKDFNMKNFPITLSLFHILSVYGKKICAHTHTHIHVNGKINGHMNEVLLHGHTPMVTKTRIPLCNWRNLAPATRQAPGAGKDADRNTAYAITMI